MNDDDMTRDLQAKRRLFAQLVADSPHNLVSARALLDLEARHIPESERFAELLPQAARCLDVGSGGGFPGMVVAMVRPDLEVHLLDATAKKVAFLEEAAARLDVQVTTHVGRAEMLRQGELGGSFDVVMARAVAPLTKLVGLVAPFLRPGGRLYAIKGDKWREELNGASQAIKGAGLRLLGTPASDPSLGPNPEHPFTPRVVMLGRST